MENKESYLEFITSENYKHQIDIWFKAYNISREKTELFYDFLISLYNLVDDTFLGTDVVYLEETQREPFTWCWYKIVDNFSKEKIYFKERGNYYEYFWNFFLEAFYFNKLDEKPIIIEKYLETLFNFKYRKTRSELDMLSEIYKLFEQNLKK